MCFCHCVPNAPGMLLRLGVESHIYHLNFEPMPYVVIRTNKRVIFGESLFRRFRVFWLQLCHGAGFS